MTRDPGQAINEDDELKMKNARMFSFGTPDKEQEIAASQMMSAGKSVRFGQSPSEMAISPIEEEQPRKAKKKSKAKYVPKSANERLIDVKNATWKTKSKLVMGGK